MGATAPAIAFLVQLGSTWTEITSDSDAEGGLRIHYGVRGNRPTDCVAGTGEAAFALQNNATAAGRLQGYYSPLHANVRSGWTYGVLCRVVFTDSADTTHAIQINRTGSTATVDQWTHGLVSGDWVRISGAVETEYNGVHRITVTTPSTFTYSVSGTPATPATGAVLAQRVYVKHNGKVRVIDPDAGQALTQRVRVVSYDGMRDLAEADVREVGVQTDQRDDQLATTLLDSLPSDAQPAYRDLDVGVDTQGYAFHDLGGGRKALTVLKSIALDGYSLIAMKGDGTLMLRTRASRQAVTSSATLSNTMHGLSVPSTLDNVYNLVRVKIHPTTIDAAATTVLYSTVGSVPYVEAGKTITIWAEYRDPDETRILIGGLNIVNPLVSGTDYAGNSQADGLGADLSASLSIALTPFATTAKIAVTNNHASSRIYLVNGSGIAFLQIRGKGVYDLGARTFEASSTQSYGTRPLTLDLHYQDDPLVAQDYATFVEAQRRTLSNQPDSLTFLANDSAALLTQALAREPGDVITFTETMTGYSAVDAAIQSVELTVTPGNWIVCRWGLAPTTPYSMWQLGTAGVSELGSTTILGF